MRGAVAVILTLGALVAAAPAGAAPTLVRINSFENPTTYATGSPGDSHRLFVVERTGRVRVVLDGQKLAQPFLDITGDVTTDGERGLLSIAFPPDYLTSGLFYVFLASATPTGHIEVREYRRDAFNPDVADPASRRTILSVDHARFSNHNGGQLQFGPDGRLWIGTGDGGGSNDTLQNAQNRDALLGKLLRMDPRAGGPPEVFSIGLRNPWRFSFDDRPGGTGDLLIGDVGQGAREEVDRAPASLGWRPGANYGWPCFEGTLQNSAISPDCDPPGKIAPVLERQHSSTVCSISGGYVVRDPGLPTLLGRYLYGDVCDDHLRSFALNAPGTDAPLSLPDKVSTVVSFGQDACGRIYVVSLPGEVFRLQDGAPTPCDLPGPPRLARPVAPPPPPTSTAARDRRAPKLRVRVAGAAKLLRTRKLKVSLRADEGSQATVSGRLPHVGAFKGAHRRLRAGRRTTATLRISRKTARRLRRALRRHRVVLKVSATARDAAGNRRKVTRRVVLRRRA